jgi:radical SAM protein with 4Fe4S-binding SPASM domain
MDPALFKRIVDEIGQSGVTRRVSPFLTNEPFLDPDIVEKSRYIVRTVPRCDVVVTTNAGRLSPDVVDDIVRDNPFHAIYISMQGIEKEPYERVMRGALRFEETKRNVEYLIDQRNQHLPHLKIVVTMVQDSLIDADRAVTYWRGRGVQAQYTVLENRGGNFEGFSNLADGKAHVFRDCARLFKTACITFDGEMVLCCADYARSMVLGNVTQDSIASIWNSPRAATIRRNFILNDFSENPLCAQCVICDP